MRNPSPTVRKVAFRMLQQEWYAKLAATGFHDIEGGREDGMLSVEARSNRLGVDDATTAKRGGLDALTYTSTLTYFSQASEFLWAKQWSTFREREVWRMHCEGESLRAIAAVLGEQLCGAGSSNDWRRRKVERTVNALKAEHTAWRAAGCPKVKAAPVAQLSLLG